MDSNIGWLGAWVDSSGAVESVTALGSQAAPWDPGVVNDIGELPVRPVGGRAAGGGRVAGGLANSDLTGGYLVTQDCYPLAGEFVS